MTTAGLPQAGGRAVVLEAPEPPDYRRFRRMPSEGLYLPAGRLPEPAGGAGEGALAFACRRSTSNSPDPRTRSYIRVDAHGPSRVMSNGHPTIVIWSYTRMHASSPSRTRRAAWARPPPPSIWRPLALAGHASCSWTSTRRATPRAASGGRRRPGGTIYQALTSRQSGGRGRRLADCRAVEAVPGPRRSPPDRRRSSSSRCPTASAASRFPRRRCATTSTTSSSTARRRSACSR